MYIHMYMFKYTYICDQKILFQRLNFFFWVAQDFLAIVNAGMHKQASSRRMLQSVAVCCSEIQCVAVCCSVFQRVAVRFSKY